MLRHLPAEKGTARLPAPVGHARHELLHLVGVELARRDVVEQEQRLGPDAHDVVDAHGHEVDPDGVVSARGTRHQKLRAHPVGGGHQHGPAVAGGVEGEAAPEPADTAQHLGARRAGHQVRMRGHGGVTRLDVDSGSGVGGAGALRRSRRPAQAAADADRARSVLPAATAPGRARVVPGETGRAEAAPGASMARTRLSRER